MAVDLKGSSSRARGPAPRVEARVENASPPSPAEAAAPSPPPPPAQAPPRYVVGDESVRRELTMAAHAQAHAAQHTRAHAQAQLRAEQSMEARSDVVFQRLHAALASAAGASPREALRAVLTRLPSHATRFGEFAESAQHAMRRFHASLPASGTGAWSAEDARWLDAVSAGAVGRLALRFESQHGVISLAHARVIEKLAGDTPNGWQAAAQLLAEGAMDLTEGARLHLQAALAAR